MIYEKVYIESVPLFKNELVENLLQRSRESGANNNKEDFANWVRKTYEDLSKIPEAKCLMELAYISKAEIIYLPEKNKLSESEFGLAIPEVGKIFIAAGSYQFENQHNHLKGLIIHELCHFAVYEVFCNDGKAFFSTDKFWEECWNSALKECFSRQSEEPLIKEIIDNYPHEKHLSELVARCFQYHIEFFYNPVQIKNFKDNFPKLLKICSDYVLPNIQGELVKISAIANINSQFFQRNDLRYYLNYRVSNTDSFHFDNILRFGDSSSKILKTNFKILAINYIYHQVFSARIYRRVQYVFLDLNYLSIEENYNMFKTATLRKVPCLFFIINTHLNESDDILEIFHKITEQLLGTESKLIFVTGHSPKSNNQIYEINYSPIECIKMLTRFLKGLCQKFQ